MGLTFTDVGYVYSPGSTLAVEALRGVSMSISQQEIVLILGATGSGKSTLLRLAAGLLTATSGAVSIDGDARVSDAARGRVGLVFQDAESQLFADTVLEDVSFGPRNMGADRQSAGSAAIEALNRVGLDPAVFGERSPFALSGGEARRAAIAGVLAMRPRYLLADEPTAGLDAVGRSAVHGLILEARDHAGVVVVSHSAEEFLGHADRVLLLSQGRVQWWGSGEDLVQQPELFERAGLTAPDILEVQRIARDRGLIEGPLALDIENVAARIASRAGVQR